MCIQLDSFCLVTQHNVSHVKAGIELSFLTTAWPQPLEMCQPLAGAPWVFVDQMEEEIRVLHAMVKRAGLDHSELPKEQPQPIISQWTSNLLPRLLLVKQAMESDRTFRETEKKHFFLQKNSSQYVSEAKNKEPGRKLQSIALPLEGLWLWAAVPWTYSFISNITAE